ncbi:DUF3037 domain-containing protein [Parapedobacter sp. SGR-10]|uniref:DUF3037 domain-containing protein n=1 Tax=Parapedobacter sp. SGR-10 TaxID=2710879 RepID=UPI0013D06AAB|nr:DUF3037 domain-containing protein [Parapedobacter sp. SGR-10]NGF57110.1 DUF3037 domain-containing protein [Parapedobacter sp. SGR-10]
MNERTVYEYAVVRVVPRVEREEFVNVGVALYCRRQRFAAVRIHVDRDRLRAIDPDVDIDLIERHLESFQRICAGERDGGQIAQLDQAERFRWLTAKRSTMIQCSVSHPGLCVDAQQTLDELFAKLVL